MSAISALSRSSLVAMLFAGFIGCASPPMTRQGPLLLPPTAESMNAKTVFGNAPKRWFDRAARQATPKLEPVMNDASGPRRAGLATAFGESTKSDVDYTHFKRGFLAKPFAVGVAYYNDAKGAYSMANYLGTPIPLRGGLVTAAKGVVDWGLKTPGSDYLGGYLVDGKVILKGEKGERYAIVLRNNTRQPLEFVISVDGLDVLDGRPASYSKRGYIVGPKRTIEVKGFRTSTSRVAAFRFGEVSDSYAVLRHDDDRNVGVIGVAVFTRQGKNPWVISNELPRRQEADPFPAGRFALPPH